MIPTDTLLSKKTFRCIPAERMISTELVELDFVSLCAVPEVSHFADHLSSSTQSYMRGYESIPFYANNKGKRNLRQSHNLRFLRRRISPISLLVLLIILLMLLHISQRASSKLHPNPPNLA